MLCFCVFCWIALCLGLVHDPFFESCGHGPPLFNLGQTLLRAESHFPLFSLSRYPPLQPTDHSKAKLCRAARNPQVRFVFFFSLVRKAKLQVPGSIFIFFKRKSILLLFSLSRVLLIAFSIYLRVFGHCLFLFVACFFPLSTPLVFVAVVFGSRLVVGTEENLSELFSLARTLFAQTPESFHAQLLSVTSHSIRIDSSEFQAIENMLCLSVSAQVRPPFWSSLSLSLSCCFPVCPLFPSWSVSLVFGKCACK